MSTTARLLVAIMIVAVASTVVLRAAPAQLVNPFGRATEKHPLDPEDLELMMGAIRDALEKYAVGGGATWQSATSDRAGQAIVTETFEKQGMRCAQVTHHFTQGQGGSYTAPLCKTADGSWKFAF